MKYLDLVEVINDNQEYKKYGVHKGMVGMLTDAEIRDTEFFVTFSHNYFPDKEDVYIPIYVGDLKVVEDGRATEEQILNDLPKNDPRWWCKVEDGYIVNLLGEKKNKIPYDYKS